MVYLTGGEPTRRESLTDTIAVRTPMAIPMIARFPNVSIDHTVVEWSLDEPFTSSSNVRSVSNPHVNSQLESSLYSVDSATYPVRAKAITEIHHRAIRLSGSDLPANVAGMNSTFDYRADQVVTRHLNGVDQVLLYGRGSPEIAGTGATTPRKCQGLLWWAAHTGLERTAGSAASMRDPYNVLIPSSMYSVFVDFENTPITGDSFYNNLIARAGLAGADLSVPWTFQCGRRVMGRVAKFLMTDAGVMVNERQVSAESAEGHDYLVRLRLPDSSVVHFRVNHWLDAAGSTYTVDNRQFTPGTPNEPGTVNKTFQGNQTLLGHKPGSVEVCWYREPAFEASPYTGGDFIELAVKSEFTLRVAHPLDVMGAGNVLA